jgi:uncharacterized protein (UPF0333 family)
MDFKAQVSIEYLLTLLFSIILVMAAVVFLDSLRMISATSKAKMIEAREETISAVIGG